MAAAAPALAAPDDAAAQWIVRLGSDNLKERLAAAYDYGELVEKPAATIPSLIEALHHPSPAVREHAAAALGEIPGQASDTVPALMSALRDQEPVVQSQAALALAKIGEPAGQAIMTALLAPEAFANPKSNALLWEDYAVAALMLMQERSAAPLADGLISLASYSHACEARHGPRIPHPAYAGREFKFLLIHQLAMWSNAPGARAIAERLIGAATAQGEPLRTKLQDLAFEMLDGADSSAFIDEDANRTAMLADFLASHRCETGSSDWSGDLALKAIDKALAVHAVDRAAELIGSARFGGPAVEIWAPRVEQYLTDADPKVRDAAVTWIARNSFKPVPLSARLLHELAQSSDDRTAAAGAQYLLALGDGDAAIGAFADILRRPQLDVGLRSDMLRKISELDGTVPSLEPVLRELAAAEIAASNDTGACDAVEALSAIGVLSAETRAVLIGGIKADRCLFKAARLLARQGMPGDEAIAAAALSSDSPQAAQVRAVMNSGEEGPDRWELRPRRRADNDPESDLGEAMLLERIASDNLLGLRKLTPPPRPGDEVPPFWFPRAPSLDEPIALLERLDATDIDQANPIFSALTDLKIFQAVQDKVAQAAEARLELANIEIEPTAAASMTETFGRLLPKWPWGWPPPKYSSWSVIPLDGLAQKATIGMIFDRLDKALEQNGYRENRIYGIPSGVAVVTHLEQTTQNGYPIPGDTRWNGDRGFSLVRMFSETFAGIRAHYRMFAFFMTRQADISGGQNSLPLEQARDPSVDGARVLPPEIRSVPWNGFFLHAVTYRFSKVNSKVVVMKADLPSTEQLRRAGVMMYLAGRQ